MNFNAEFAEYFDDDTLAADWLNELVRRISWDMFHNQQEWIYMHGELTSVKPCLKDNFFDVAGEAFDREIASLRSAFLVGLAKLHMEQGDIDVTPHIAQLINEYYDVEYLEEGYEDYYARYHIDGVEPELAEEE